MKYLNLLFAGFLISLASIFDVFGQSSVIYQDSAVKKNNYCNIQNFFLEKEMELSKKMPIYLYSITHKIIEDSMPAPKLFRITGDYLFRFNTFNIGLSFNPSMFKKGSPMRFYIGPRIGFGTQPSVFYKKNTTDNAKINTLLGGEVELEGILNNKQAKPSKFGIYGGIGFYYLAIEKYEPNEYNGRAAIDLFLGPRYYLIDNKKLSIQARVGSLWTAYNKNIDETAIYYGLGLSYYFGTVKKKAPPTYNGFFEIHNDKDTKLQVKVFDPLPKNATGDRLIEKHVYKIADTDTVFLEKIVQVSKSKITPQLPNIDVADIEILTLDFNKIVDVHWLGNQKKYPAKEQSKQKMVLLVAKFDRERTNVDKLDDDNMYLVFTDLIKSRYFGFNYDVNQRLQTESDSGDLRVNDQENPFYGNYSEFVKNLRWLDTDSITFNDFKIDGREIERDILRSYQQFNNFLKDESTKQNITPYYVTKENFRFAYAVYPEETFLKVKKACPNYVYSLMFNFFDATGELNTRFFSNIFKGDEINSAVNEEDVYNSTDFNRCNQTITLDNFGLGKDRITPENMDKLARAGILQCRCNRIVVIEGYTDKVEFTKNANIIEKLIAVKNNEIVNKCESLKEHRNYLIREWNEKQSNEPPDDLLQRTLAWFRILSALTELDKLGADITNAVAEPVGIFTDPEYDYESYNSAARKVEIHFE